jgi:diguanylate cyclase (GGDEF)-like protein/PAS domain S-box-containing protein
MPILDLRTVLINYICGNLVCTIVLSYLWWQNRRFQGIGYWALSFLSNFTGIVLISGRGIIPDFFSMLLGGLFLLAGTYLLYKGLALFLCGIKKTPLHLYALLAIYIFLQVYFIYISPNFGIRNILFSVTLVFFTIQLTWLLFLRVDKTMRKLTNFLGGVTSIFGVLAIIRIVLNIVIYPGVDPQHSAFYEAYLYLAFQLMYVILTIGLFMLVNRRLMMDLEIDIIKREETETELDLSREKFAKAFQASPTAILITRISDGLIIDINDGFTKIMGYSRDEVMGETTKSINIWANPEDRNFLVREMREKSHLKNHQFDFRVKSGAIIRGEMSSEYIRLGDDECMLSAVQDITERKRMEDILHLRLKLSEFSLTHSAIEVMVKALDEIEDITGSQIGFYHLVEEDSNSLTLQAWSTRTTKEYCHAEGSGMHYSIDQAGVWVDCIRERKTIIHNDYASLPNKHGLPEGHSILKRELLVPIFHQDQIVSVLGVGNKQTEYNQNDVDIVEYIASLVWSIVTQKRADEKIQNLNEKLAALALVDELTKLPNRRAFFLRGAEEVNRSKRYQSPLSMLMLDIDRFKSINDTYGHARGDMALQCIARVLREQVREVDLPGRLGGEEFGILLPNTRLEEALVIAERIRKSIEALRCEKDEEVCVTMTASLGVADFNSETKSLDELFNRADTAMYFAKNNGRNRVEVYQPDASPRQEKI